MMYGNANPMGGTDLLYDESLLNSAVTPTQTPHDQELAAIVQQILAQAQHGGQQMMGTPQQNQQGQPGQQTQRFDPQLFASALKSIFGGKGGNAMAAMAG